MTRSSSGARWKRVVLEAVALFSLGVASGAVPASAEPAIAVRTGYRCGQCHLNHTGGGMRTAFGSLYTQTTLPQNLIRWREWRNLLPADPDARFAFGTDARFVFQNAGAPSKPRTSAFDVSEANVYGEGRLVPGWLSVYVDLRAGPGGASARELFALWTAQRWNAYLKAGKLLPVFGWRLPDDNAFIRQFTGFTYSAPDIGIEAGIEPGAWSMHLSVVNGSSGGAEDNRSKQLSFLGVRRFSNWRVGVSSVNNIAGGVRTTQAGLLGGVNFGRLALLGELDRREAHSGTGTLHSLAALIEGDLLVARGVNVKLAHDWTDPNRDVTTDSRVRDSLGVEYIPFPFLQLRLFARRSDGPPQVRGTRSHEVDLEAHVFF